MKVEIESTEVERVAEAWINAQAKKVDGFKVVLDALLRNRHMAVWSWRDALQYAVDICVEEYCVTPSWIKGGLK